MPAAEEEEDKEGAGEVAVGLGAVLGVEEAEEDEDAVVAIVERTTTRAAAAAAAVADLVATLVNMVQAGQ